MKNRNKSIQLRFRPFDHDAARQKQATLVEVDEDGSILKCGTRAEVADWLKLMGYRYIPGTNGLWAKH